MSTPTPSPTRVEGHEVQMSKVMRSNCACGSGQGTARVALARLDCSGVCSLWCPVSEARRRTHAAEQGRLGSPSRLRDAETSRHHLANACAHALRHAAAQVQSTSGPWPSGPATLCASAATQQAWVGRGGTFCTGHGVEGQEVQASKVKRSKSKYTCGRCPRDVSRSLLCAVLHCSTGTCEQNMMSCCG
jgi:hypothetical protein